MVVAEENMMSRAWVHSGRFHLVGVLGLALLIVGCPQGVTISDGNSLDGLLGQFAVQGPRGLQGPAGPAGPQGLRGDTGATGPVGADGTQGAQGDPGDTGPEGQRGARGETGPAGPTGADGPAGPAGATGPAGPAGAQGDPGPTGPSGATGSDGSIRLYGDGSAGARTISSNMTLSDTNLQYTDFTIDAGVILSLNSGTVIRCTGTFTNNGTLVVFQAAAGGVFFCPNGCTSPTYQAPDPGNSLGPPGFGEMGDASFARLGGSGGRGLTPEQARSLLRPGLRGGGGGLTTAVGAASGGGSLIVLAQQAIAITATGVIRANGEVPDGNGESGAGGGILVLATPGSLTHDGALEAIGSDGNQVGTNVGPAGGGGGGIVHLISPNITNNGTVGVNGGLGGPSAVPGTFATPINIGGLGGGACGGGGGFGGSVLTDGSATAAGDGQDGHFLSTVADPTGLLL